MIKQAPPFLHKATPAGQSVGATKVVLVTGFVVVLVVVVAVPISQKTPKNRIKLVYKL